MTKLPTLTELGKLYKIKDPYGKGYSALYDATWNAIGENKQSYIDGSDVTLHPDFIEKLKLQEKEDMYLDDPRAGLGMSVKEMREVPDFIPVTMAQLFHLLATGTDIFPDRKHWWGIRGAAEIYGDPANARVPVVCWDADNEWVGRDWYYAGYSDDYDAVRGAVRSPESLVFIPSDSLSFTEDEIRKLKALTKLLS